MQITPAHFYHSFLDSWLRFYHLFYHFCTIISPLFTTFYHYFTTFHHSLSTFYHLPLRARPRFGSGPIALMNFTVYGDRVRVNSGSGKIYHFLQLFTTLVPFLPHRGVSEFYHFFTT